MRVRNPTLQLFFSCYSQCRSLCSVSRLVSVKKVVVSLDWSMRTLTINYDLGDSFLAYEVASWESSATAGHCSILYLGPADFLLLSMSRIMINDLLLLQLGPTSCQTLWWTWITSNFGPKSLLNDNLIEKAFNKVKLYFFLQHNWDYWNTNLHKRIFPHFLQWLMKQKCHTYYLTDVFVIKLY